MPLYQTKYDVPDPRRGGEMFEMSTECYAQDYAHLREVLAMRKLGERSQGLILDRSVRHKPLFRYPRPKRPSELLRAGEWSQAVHAGCWLGMIATRAGTIEPWDLLHDFGLIHESAHMMLNGGDPTGVDLERLIEKWEDLERRTPGCHPCWAKPDVYVNPRA